MIHHILKLLAVTSITLVSTQLAAIEFGTKFACCSQNENSSLGGGGCVVPKRTLRDRALTQVDAGARCLALGSTLQWGTHSCPAPSGNCSVSKPVQKLYSFSFHNKCDREVKVLTKDRRGNETSWNVHGYFFLKPNQKVALVPNSNMYMVSYWAQSLDGSKTWENGKFMASGNPRKPVQYAGKDHYMNYVTVDQNSSGKTINLTCN